MGPIIKCLTCGARIQSKHRHDFVSCECPPNSDTWIAVDGGDDYRKMSIGKNSRWEKVNED